MVSRRPPHPHFAVVGPRVQCVRKTAGWTQEGLASAIGVSTRTISNLECGTFAVSLERLFDIAAVLKVRLGALVDAESPLPVASPPPETAEILQYYLRLSDADRALAVRLVRDVAAERGHAHPPTKP